MKQTDKQQEGMHPVRRVAVVKLRSGFDDRVIASSVIALMLMERKRRQDFVKGGKNRSALWILKRKL